MKNIFKLTLLYVSLIFLMGCPGPGPDPDPPPPPPTGGGGNNPPTTSCSDAAINLIFPLDGEECQEGEIEDGKISTPFRWNAQGGASVTGLTILNLTDNVDVPTDGLTIASNVAVPLEFGKEYQWQVVGSCNNTTVSSTPRTFTTQGPPNNNVAPYPAVIEIINNANRQATIEWTVDDEDNEELTFQVFLDKDPDPSTLISNNITSPSGDTNRLTRSFDSGGTYYVKIVAEDTAGNRSTSIESFVVL